MLQTLWKLKIDWDESLPADIHTEWLNYIKGIQDFNELGIPRKVVESGQDIQVDLHGFSDASARAYGACVYIRSSNAHGFLQSQLVASKSRVALIKAISIPRLKLCGAQLLIQLMDKIKCSLELRINRTYFWTDSSIVIHWLKAIHKKLPVFVAHRVGEIQELSSVENWNHVATNENPADLISRGATPKELISSQLWWNGPMWLQSENNIIKGSEIPELNENQLNELD